MNAGVVIVLGLVAIGLLIYLYMIFGKEAEPAPTVQEMMMTKEGREELAKVGGRDATSKPIVLCPNCEGYGKPHHTRLTAHGVEHYTDPVMCIPCEGTGLRGGSPDYRNVICQACEGRGFMGDVTAQLGPACGICRGTGVVRREKIAHS